MDDFFPGSAETAEAPTVVIGPRGQWFAVGDLRVDLSRRKPVARLLWALALGSQRPSLPGLATPELIASSWPGEKLVRNAGRIRLRVAIATLRAMGLGARIVTTRVGYMIDGPLMVQGAESEAPPSHVTGEDMESQAEAS